MNDFDEQFRRSVESARRDQGRDAFRQAQRAQAWAAAVADTQDVLRRAAEQLQRYKVPPIRFVRMEKGLFGRVQVDAKFAMWQFGLNDLAVTDHGRLCSVSASKLTAEHPSVRAFARAGVHPGDEFAVTVHPINFDPAVPESASYGSFSLGGDQIVYHNYDDWVLNPEILRGAAALCARRGSI